MLQAAVVGVGHLGRWHAQKYHQIEGVNLVAVVDCDKSRAQQVAAECNCQSYTDYKQLPDDVSLVSLAVDTKHHFAIARDLINANKHLLIEKPMCETIQEARELIDLAASKNIKIQVGHIEQFNPAMITIKKHINNPLFIECIRLSPFVQRGGIANVNVILDIMIHDIDLTISLLDSQVKNSATIGASVVADDIDIVNSRIEFMQGCVVNITASRISKKHKRIVRVFQNRCYMVADLQKKAVRIHTMDENNKGHYNEELLTFDKEKSDSLKQQILSFIKSVTNGTPVQVTGEDGYKALSLAQTISQQAYESLHRLSQ